LVWGDDWDLVFPLYKLYYNKLDSKRGRKKVADKKVLVRLYINESVVNKNGGMENAKKVCEKALNG